MTTAEAIEYFENRKLILASINLPGLEACDKALEALRTMRDIEKMNPLVISAKAIADIDQMVAELKHLKPTICTADPEIEVVDRRWIPASDPPKDDKKVLVYTKHGSQFIASYDQQFRHWRCSKSLSITHWMPLPEAPKEG